jgi:hypothetical protein
MIWRFVYALAGFTFTSTGYSVLVDPECQKVKISGIRFFSVSCQSNSGGYSALLVGLTSMVIGLIVIFINGSIFYQAFKSNRQSMNQNQISEELTVSNVNEPSRSESVASFIIFLLIPIILFSSVFYERQQHRQNFINHPPIRQLCIMTIKETSNFSLAMAATQKQADPQQASVLVFLHEENFFANLSGKASGDLKKIFEIMAIQFEAARQAAIDSDQGAYDSAKVALNSAASNFDALCAKT